MEVITCRHNHAIWNGFMFAEENMFDIRHLKNMGCVTDLVGSCISLSLFLSSQVSPFLLISACLTHVSLMYFCFFFPSLKKRNPKEALSTALARAPSKLLLTVGSAKNRPALSYRVKPPALPCSTPYPWKSKTPRHSTTACVARKASETKASTRPLSSTVMSDGRETKSSSV